MNIDMDLTTVKKQLKPFIEVVRKYAVFSFAILMLLLISFLVYRVNVLSQQEPTEDAIQEKIQSVPRPRVDQDVVERIEELRDQNVRVEALFDKARNNPFAE